MKIIQYTKSLLSSFVFVLLSSFIISILYFFKIINNNILTYLYLIIPILAILLGSFLLGRVSKEKGWLEGLKFGALYLIIMTIFSLFIFKNDFVIKVLLYDIIILLSAMLGSMIGINFKKCTL